MQGRLELLMASESWREVVLGVVFPLALGFLPLTSNCPSFLLLHPQEVVVLGDHLILVGDVLPGQLDLEV